MSSFSVSDFLKGLQSAVERGKKERFKPFFSYTADGEILEVYLSPKEGLNVPLTPGVEIQIDAANRDEIIGFRFHGLKPPPTPILDENGEDIHF